MAYPNEDGTKWIKNTDSDYTSYSYSNEAYYYYYNDNETYKYCSYTNNFSDAIIKLEKQKNEDYIFFNDNNYFVATRSMYIYENEAYFCTYYVENGLIYFYDICYSDENGGYNLDRAKESLSVRPVVVLSSEIPWDEVKDLIKNYVEY